jgi:hypothetical protein
VDKLVGLVLNHSEERHDLWGGKVGVVEVGQLCDCATKRRTDHGLNALPLTVVTPFGTLTCLMIFFSPLFPTCTPAPLLMVITAPSMTLQYSVLLLEATLSTFSGPDPTFLQDTPAMWEAWLEQERAGQSATVSCEL